MPISWQLIACYLRVFDPPRISTHPVYDLLQQKGQREGEGKKKLLILWFFLSFFLSFVLLSMDGELQRGLLRYIFFSLLFFVIDGVVEWIIQAG